MRISDWSSDVCSSDLAGRGGGPSGQEFNPGRGRRDPIRHAVALPWCRSRKKMIQPVIAIHGGAGAMSRAAMSPEKEQEYLAALNGILAAGQAVLAAGGSALDAVTEAVRRSDAHTSELQSLMRTSYAVFCLK